MKIINLIQIMICIYITASKIITIVKNIPQAIQIQQGFIKQVYIKNYISSLPLSLTALPFNADISQEIGLINIILINPIQISQPNISDNNNTNTIDLNQNTQKEQSQSEQKSQQTETPVDSSQVFQNNLTQPQNFDKSNEDTIDNSADIQNEQSELISPQTEIPIDSPQLVQNNSTLVSYNSNNNLQQDPDSSTLRLRNLIQQPFYDYKCQIIAPYKTCLMPENKLENSLKTLKFNISCTRGPCNFKIHATQQLVGELQSISPTILQFDQEIIKIIKLPILNIEYQERFILDIEFDKKDTNVNKSQIHFPSGVKTISVEGDRLIVQFGAYQQKNISRTCLDCQMQGIIISDPGTTANIFFFKYGEKVQIYPSVQYIDRAYSNILNKYLIKLEDVNSYDYIEFTAMFLSTQDAPLVLYLHGDKIPKNAKDYYWVTYFQNSLDSDGEAFDIDQQRNKKYKLVITKSQLIDLDMTGEEFYLSIVSEVSASFSFQYKVEVNSLHPMHLEIDEISCGKIENFQVQPYLFEVDKNPKLIISLKLQIMEGDSTIYINKYSSLQDFKQTNILEIKGNSIGKFIDSGSKKEISLQSKCPELVCKFIIYVVGTSRNSTKYMLEASYGYDNKVELGENVAYSGLLRWGSQKYFVHYLQNPENIILFTVQISCQEIDIFVSLSDNCQNPNDKCEKVIKGGSRKPIILNQIQLTSKNAVYIGIQAVRHCEYSLAVKIKRANSSSILQIHEGKPYVSQLNQQTLINYFQYSANLGSNEGLEVNIWAPFGKIIILATNDGSFPDLQNKQYQWISRNNFLEINSKDKMFKSTGNYIVSVILSENAIQSTDLSFKIMISSSSSIKVMDLNEPFFDTILPFGSKAYEIHVNPTEQSVILNRNILSSDEIAKDLTFYIGDDVYEDIKDYQFQLTGGDKATFQLISQNLDKLCLLDNEFCSIYILVKNYGSGQAQYTLTVLENSLAVPLLEGYQHSYTLYYVNEYMNFYYIPTHQDTSVNFYLYSFYGRTNFSVSVWKQDDYLTQPINWPFPTDKIPQKNINYNSAIHNSHSISISPSSFNQCWPSCKVLISVSFLEEDEYNSTSAQQFDDQFTLIASTVYNNIYDDDRVQFTLEEQESKYFFFDIKNILIQNIKGNSILCQLTPLSGRGIMAASIKDDQNNRMPLHLISSDFISYNNHLEISLTMIKKIMKKQKISNFSNPTIVFEISAYGSTGKFIFSIYNNQNDVRDILNGVPFDFNVNQNSEVVFQFFNYFKSDIQIRISREIGFGDLYLYTCETNLAQCITQQEPDQSIRMVGSSGNVIQIKQSSDIFCFYCFYLIKIKNPIIDQSPTTVLKGYIYILIDSDAVWLQEGRSLIDSLGKDQTILYRLSIPTNEELELSLIQYTGSVTIYINYQYETNYKKFRDGPFFSNLQSLNKFFQLRIPARDTLMLDDKSKIPTNDGLSTEFVENEIYVLVRNTGTTSKYSISFSSGELEKFIIDGQMLFQNLESQQTLRLIYSYFDRDAPAILSLSLLNPQDVSLDLIQIDAWVIPQQSFYDVTDGKYMKNFSLEVKSRRDNTITLNLPQITGSYEIEFINNNKKSANFSTYINTRDMTLMPFNTKIQHLLPDNSVNYYEFLIPRKGYLGLEMIHCVGDLLIGYSQNYDSFLKHEFIKSSTSQQGHTFIDPIQVKSGPIYFALITQDQEAFYTISGNWYRSIKEIPQIKLKAGNDGLVAWTRDRSNNAFFEFFPLKCVECNTQEKNDPKVVYEIFISKDEEILNVIGKCDAKQYFEHEAAEMDDYLQKSKFKPSDFINGISSKAFPMNLDSQLRLNYSMKLNEYQTIYYGGIKATIKNFPGIDGDIVVFYENLYIGEDPLEFMVIALASFLLVLILCLFIALIGRRVYKNTLDRVIQDTIQDFSGPKQYNSKKESQIINQEESQSQVESGLKTAQDLSFTTNKGYASLEDEM